MHNDLVLVPVINKIDLPQIQMRTPWSRWSISSACPVRSPARQRQDSQGLPELFEVVRRIPPPKGDPGRAPQGPPLRFLVRHLPGRYRPRPRPRRRAQDRGPDRPHGLGSRNRGRGGGYPPRPSLSSRGSCGPVRSATSSPASRSSATHGSATPSLRRNRPTATPLPGFKEAKPMVFCGIFPAGESNIEDSANAVEKLRLNDHVAPGSSLRTRRPSDSIQGRLPRSPSPGDRPGEARARLRVDPDHDRRASAAG